ncbi:hypothetical protein PHMEG_00040016 [Phytophthora megakarya]|uniref:Uncharacterized protein n=1 Tax=Phytophthora megakarya TaxID=4795 RepID=A0A225UEN2_9STRA|nr:hypothetical protein PHMEG_00040016 [Phytophthora megakarya]
MARCNGHKADGIRCRIKFNVNDLGFCRFHEWQGRPRCQGVNTDTKEPCTNHAKKDYTYCCAAHDPTLEYIAPRVFDPLDFYLRRQVEADVVERYNSNDIYNHETLDMKTPNALELDHIVEKQIFSFAMIQTGIRQGDGDFDVATDVLRENVVNELDNLALTRRNTNRIKGTGVFKYLDDSRTGHCEQSFTGYLLTAKRDGETLTRDVSRRIRRNMGRSIKKCQRKLSDEGDTPVLEKLSTQLQQLYVDMELKVRHTQQ